MRYFSMFSGIGGFELGIERTFELQQKERNLQTKEQSSDGNNRNSTRETSAICIGFSEIDKYAIQTYQKHFPEHKNFGDATKINPAELPDFDMLCAGFPCQAFSIAGRRQGFNDTRGTLFFEIARVLKVKRPRLILLENVKGLLNHNKGETFRVILQTLSELGYEIQWMVLNSKFFGVPQNRERVFIIGSLGGTSRPKILPFKKGNGIYNEKEYERSAKAMTSTMFKGIGNDGTTLIDERDRELTRIYDIEGNAPTLKGKTGGWQEPKICMNTITEAVGTRQGSSKEFMKSVKCIYLAHQEEGRWGKRIVDEMGTLGTSNDIGIIKSMKIRRLTPIECERLQGFPDSWTKGVSDTQRYRQLGNAVTVNVIEAIMKRLSQEVLL